MLSLAKGKEVFSAVSRVHPLWVIPPSVKIIPPFSTHTCLRTHACFQAYAHAGYSATPRALVVGYCPVVPFS